MNTHGVHSSAPKPAALGDDSSMSAAEAIAAINAAFLTLAQIYSTQPQPFTPEVQAEIQRITQQIQQDAATPGVDSGTLEQVSDMINLLKTNPTDAAFEAYVMSIQPGQTVPVYMVWLQQMQSAGYNPASGGAPNPDVIYYTTMAMAFLESLPSSKYTDVVDQFLSQDASNGNGADFGLAELLDAYSNIPGNPSLSLIESLLNSSSKSSPEYQKFAKEIWTLASMNVNITQASLNLEGILHAFFNNPNSSSGGGSSSTNSAAASSSSTGSTATNSSSSTNQTGGGATPSVSSAHQKKPVVGDPLPIPNFPPIPDGGDPCPDFLSQLESITGVTDPQQIANIEAHNAQVMGAMLAWYHNHRDNLQIRGQLLEAMISLNNNGQISSDPNNPIFAALRAFVDPTGSNDTDTDTALIYNLFQNITSTLAILAFFDDKGNVSQVDQWISALSGSIQGGGFLGQNLQDYLNNQMPTQIQTFAADHTDAQGNIYWTIDGETYYWTGPLATPQSQDVILTHIAGLDNSSWTDYYDVDGNGYNEMAKQLRMMQFDSLMKQYGANNIFLIIMLLMVGYGLSYDQQFNTQLSGQTQTTKDNTKITNLIQNLSALFANAGSFTPEQSMEFFQDLKMVNTELSDMASMNGIAGQFTAQTLDVFMNQTVVYPPPPATGGQTMTLEQIYEGVKNKTLPSDALATAFQSIFTSSAGSESPGARALQDALTAGGSLLTQQTKAVNAEVTATSQLINSVDNLANLIADPTKSGSYMSFISQIIQAFKTQ